MKSFAALAVLAAFTLTAHTSAQMPAHKGTHPKPADMKEGEMPMHHAPAMRSDTLTLTGLDGKTVTLTPADFARLPHITTTVHNGHADKDETYTGVPVAELAKLVTVPGKPKVSPRTTILIFGATDDFHVVLTACDTDTACHNGQTIVADTQDGTPLNKDGAFKLIISEDKKPGRWTRNLSSITVKSVE